MERGLGKSEGLIQARFTSSELVITSKSMRENTQETECSNTYLGGFPKEKKALSLVRKDKNRNNRFKFEQGVFEREEKKLVRSTGE